MNQSEKTKTFLNELVEVCKKHKLSLGHEDIQGAFIVTVFDLDNIAWLNEAQDLTEERNKSRRKCP